jgi:hypothetical protein
VAVGRTPQIPRTPSERQKRENHAYRSFDLFVVARSWNQILSPRREETLFSDHLITIAGRSITITSHDMLMIFVSVVTGLAFWTALYFSRKRVVVLKRSSGTDQVTLQLSRIAEALERIANRPADDAIAAAPRRQQQIQPPRQRESKGVAYSMFGR